MYIEKIMKNPIARKVKPADLKDNMDVRRLPSGERKELMRLRKYHEAWKKLKQQAPHTWCTSQRDT